MTETTTALELRPADALPEPVHGPDAMVRAFRKYQELRIALAKEMPEAFQQIRDKLHPKKAVFLSLGVAFNLSVEPVEERRVVRGEFDDGSENFGYLFVHRATAPNGRTITGDGACFAAEKHPSQRTEHNVRAHASTRSLNRAISNLVAFGELSAEEMQDGDATTTTPRRSVRASSEGSSSASHVELPPPSSSRRISDPQRKRLWAIAKGAGWADEEIRDHLRRYGFEHSNEVTVEVYDTICKELEHGVDSTREGAR